MAGKGHRVAADDADAKVMLAEAFYRRDERETRLKLVKTDPLPLVSVRVNGGDEVTFFIDTGVSEVVLDTDFAKELGVPQFGAVQGTFSGGQHAEVQNGRIESLTVGDWTVKNCSL